MDQDKQKDQVQEAHANQSAPQPQVVQHVVQEKPLKGIGGALIFWLIIFALFVIGYLVIFASALSGEGSTGENIIALLLSPILAFGFAASTVLISLQKKLAVLVTLIVLGVHAVYASLDAIVAYAANRSDAVESLPMLIVQVIVIILLAGLVGLYFVVSKRVKQTLIG